MSAEISAETKNKINMNYVHFAVVLLLMFGFRFLPPIGTITPYGMTIIGIFIGMIYGWSVDANNLIWTSLLGLFAMGFSGSETISGAGPALASAFGNESVVLMLLGMFFLGMLQESGLTELLANKLLGAKVLQGRPWMLTGFMMLAPAFMSLVVNQTLVALIMFVIFQAIFQQAGYKKGDLYPAMVLMGFMICCSIGFSLFPFRGWCLMTVGMATKAGIAINMAGWITSTTITLIVGSFGWLLIMFLIPGCKVDKLRDLDITQFQKSDANVMTKRQKAVLVVLLANVIGCIVISFASGPAGIGLVMKQCGVYGWVIFLIALSMIVKVDGKPILNKKTAPAYFYWDLILVVAAAMVVAGQLTNQATGVTAMIGVLMAPLAGLEGYWFILILGIITFIATNLANNVAVTITMLTVAMGMAAQFSFNLQLALMVITIYGVIGLLTPAGSVNGAMIHAHEFTTAKSAYISGTIMIVYLTLILALVLIPLGLKFMV